MSFAAVVERLRRLENPYPGLRPFETQESHLFFGRDQQVAELIGRLERNRFVAVVGVSGGGKSSLVRAGLIPALERTPLSESGGRWRIVVTRPAGAPFERLGADLMNTGLDAAPLTESSHGLIHVARQLAADESLLVVVDQFEELFRYKELAGSGTSDEARIQRDASAADAAEFVQLLLEASRHQPPVYVILTMRSDYLGDCAAFRDLPETLNDCQYLVPRMTREQRKEAIEGPLGQIEMEPALIQRLLNDAGDEPDQLPVLQHALLRTWNHWRRDDPKQARRIGLRDYETVGGVADALNQHADELLAGVSEDIAAAIFKRLTARGRSSRERRNPARLAELWAVCGADTPEAQARVTAVVDHFRSGEATFLVPRDVAIQAQTYIDITHESLIRQWKKLRDEWLPQEQRSAKAFLDLTARARNWQEKRGELLIGLDLADALEWDRQRNPSPAWAAHYGAAPGLEKVQSFIRGSEDQQHAQAERQRRERWRRRLAIAAVILAIPTAVAFYQYNSARSSAREAMRARIQSIGSLRDPLTRALLLAELRDDAGPEHLPIYQAAATTPIPFAVLPHLGDTAVGAGFLSDGSAAVALESGALAAWRSDGSGDVAKSAVGAQAQAATNSAATPLMLTLAAFSRDGRWTAAAQTDDNVWLHRRDGQTSTRVALSQGPARSAGARTVTALAFSHDSRQLAAGYSDYTVRVWQIDSRNVNAGMPFELGLAHTGPISSIDFDAAGARLVTGSWDGTARVWNLANRAKPSLVLGGDGEQVTSTIFSPSGAAVLIGYVGGAIRVGRSDQAGAAAASLLAHKAAVTAMAFSADGSKLLTASEDNEARVWMVRSRAQREDSPSVLLGDVVGSPTVLTHDALVSAAAFSADGKTIITASADGKARLWSSQPGEPRIVGVHDERVESVAFSPDGTLVVSASADNTARVWALDDRSTPQALTGHSDWVRSAAFIPGDTTKLVTASDDGTLRLWTLTAPPKSRVSQEADRVFSAAVNRAGTSLVTAVADGTARVWKMSDLARGASVQSTEEPLRAVELRHDTWVRAAAFSSDGARIVTATRDGRVGIWASDRSADRPSTVLPHPVGTVVFSAAFSEDGTRVVTASADNVARVWRLDVAGGPRPSGAGGPLELRHRDQVNMAAFDRGGGWIVTASKDGTARLWTADGRERIVLQHGNPSVRAAQFDSSGTQIVTGTAEGVVQLWRISLDGLKNYLREASTACVLPSVREQLLDESDSEARDHYEACEKRHGRTPAG